MTLQELKRKHADLIIQEEYPDQDPAKNEWIMGFKLPSLDIISGQMKRNGAVSEIVFFVDSDGSQTLARPDIRRCVVAGSGKRLIFEHPKCVHTADVVRLFGSPIHTIDLQLSAPIEEKIATGIRIRKALDAGLSVAVTTDSILSQIIYPSQGICFNVHSDKVTVLSVMKWTPTSEIEPGAPSNPHSPSAQGADGR